MKTNCIQNMKETLRGITNGVKNMYNNVEKFVLAGVILSIIQVLDTKSLPFDNQ